MNSSLITNLPTPTANDHAANKGYVDTNLTSGSIVNNPTVADAGNANTEYRVLFTTTTSGRATLNNDAGLTYNASTNTLTATTFSGSLSGNATTATTAGSAGSAGSAVYAERSTSNKFTINGGSGYTNDIPADTMLYMKDHFGSYGPLIRMTSSGGHHLLIGQVAGTADSYLFNTNSGYMRFGTDNVERMMITSGGNIGIGTSSPSCPLDVNGSSPYAAPATPTITFFDGLGPVPRYGNSFTFPISIRSRKSIRCSDAIIFDSDKRIKKNIKDIDGNTALSQIRQIRPKIYNYIDYTTKGNGNVYGFIAQDVKDVILHSTMCNKDYIPNFYSMGTISILDASNNIYEISSENDLSFEKVMDDSGNEVIFHKVKIYGYDNTEYICSVIQVNNTKNIRVKIEKEYKFSNKQEEYNKIFIYGQEINDFHILEKNAVWTVATAALQEVDRQQQADKARIAVLEATVAAQQSLINDILERLKTLEKA